MTSRLLVDKIEGKSTSGTIQMPSGHVVQSAFNNTELFTSTTSSTYQDLITISFTPKLIILFYLLTVLCVINVVVQLMM